MLKLPLELQEDGYLVRYLEARVENVVIRLIEEFGEPVAEYISRADLVSKLRTKAQRDSIDKLAELSSKICAFNYRQRICKYCGCDLMSCKPVEEAHAANCPIIISVAIMYEIEKLSNTLS